MTTVTGRSCHLWIPQQPGFIQPTSAPPTLHPFLDYPGVRQGQALSRWHWTGATELHNSSLETFGWCPGEYVQLLYRGYSPQNYLWSCLQLWAHCFGFLVSSSLQTPFQNEPYKIIIIVTLTVLLPLCVFQITQYHMWLALPQSVTLTLKLSFIHCWKAFYSYLFCICIPNIKQNPSHYTLTVTESSFWEKDL